METSIISWNVNGLQGILKKDIHGNKGTRFTDDNPISMMIKDQQPDIICLQEIRCSSKFNHCPHFPDYEYQYSNYAVKRGYSGTLIVSKIEPINVFYNYEMMPNITDSGLTEEGRLITLEFEDYFLVNVYAPNSGVKTFARLEWRVSIWESNFRKYLRELMETGKGVIIVGDLNVIPTNLDTSWKKVDMITGATPGERDAFQKLLKLGFTDCYRSKNPKSREYTWTVRPNAGHRMDFTLVSTLKYVNSEILDYVGSDHRPIKLSF